jgi:hypothetical protein
VGGANHSKQGLVFFTYFCSVLQEGNVFLQSFLGMPNEIMKYTSQHPFKTSLSWIFSELS